MGIIQIPMGYRFVQHSREQLDERLAVVGWRPRVVVFSEWAVGWWS